MTAGARGRDVRLLEVEKSQHAEYSWIHPAHLRDLGDVETGFLTTDDGLDLHWVCWDPGESVDGAVVLVHGLGEHMGRYGHVASALTGTGRAVFGIDLRGHGLSGGMRAYVSRFDQYVDDVHKLINYLRSRWSIRRPFLLGHSMGGLISLVYSLRHEETVQGIVAASPFIAPAIDVPKPLMALSGLLSRLAPTLPVLDISKLRLSHNKEVEVRRQRDALGYHGRVRARTGHEMNQAGQEVRRRAAELRHPLLLVHGTADPLTDWRGTCSVYGGASSEDKSLILYSGMYHETLNELGRHHVFRAINDWLDEHR